MVAIVQRLGLFFVEEKMRVQFLWPPNAFKNIKETEKIAKIFLDELLKRKKAQRRFGGGPFGGFRYR